ncbi:hypothetical protein BS78_04G252500 [Paspalum vaginatum]|nr:hypothetical protein BS78_04G252500 [Paspalum vaginatum]
MCAGPRERLFSSSPDACRKFLLHCFSSPRSSLPPPPPFPSPAWRAPALPHHHPFHPRSHPHRRAPPGWSAVLSLRRACCAPTAFVELADCTPPLVLPFPVQAWVAAPVFVARCPRHKHAAPGFSRFPVVRPSLRCPLWLCRAPFVLIRLLRLQSSPVHCMDEVELH